VEARDLPSTPFIGGEALLPGLQTTRRKAREVEDIRQRTLPLTVIERALARYKQEREKALEKDAKYAHALGDAAAQRAYVLRYKHYVAGRAPMLSIGLRLGHRSPVSGAAVAAGAHAQQRRAAAEAALAADFVVPAQEVAGIPALWTK